MKRAIASEARRHGTSRNLGLLYSVLLLRKQLRNSYPSWSAIPDTSKCHPKRNTPSPISLNLSNLPQSSKCRSHGGGGGCPAVTVNPVLPRIMSSPAVSHRGAFSVWVHVRHRVGSSSNSLVARLAVPDSDGMSLDGGLSAECADVFGVLGDFHLLDLLSEGSTVSVGRRKSQSALCLHVSFPWMRAAMKWMARRLANFRIGASCSELARIEDSASRNGSKTYLVPYFPVTPTFLVLFVILAELQ